MPLALITGATAGLGRALATTLAGNGFSLVLDGRHPDRLDALRTTVPEATVVAGDITDPAHRRALVAAVDGRPLDLLIHNASTLGPSPLVPLHELADEDLATIFETNVIAPAGLTALLLPALRAAQGALITISSDAAVEHYEGWGGYAASKAALDHLAGTWAAENPSLLVYAIDPGDMRTAMHQAAFPGEDISDRPLPDEVAIPGIVALLRAAPPSGRYRAAEFARTRGAA